MIKNHIIIIIFLFQSWTSRCDGIIFNNISFNDEIVDYCNNIHSLKTTEKSINDYSGENDYEILNICIAGLGNVGSSLIDS